MPVTVTIIIVCWNSKKYLSRCLAALSKQTGRDFEVILVDNGSTDESTAGLPENYEGIHLHVERFQTNRGFAVANNLGARLAKGHWLALLNSDAFPEADWLARLLEAAGNRPEFSFFASRQIQANRPDLLDGAGDAYHLSGLAWRRGFGYPADEFGLTPKEIFSPCAAAALYSREAFLQVGGFDEDFFSYFEDVDLGFRMRLQGYRCLYVPDAVVHHVGSVNVAARQDFSIYYWQRNLIWSFVQNMPAGLLWGALPMHFIANSLYQVHPSRWRYGQVLWRAKIDALRGLPRALRKRRQIQSQRKAKSGELLSIMEKGLLQPYLLNPRFRRLMGAK